MKGRLGSKLNWPCRVLPPDMKIGKSVLSYTMSVQKLGSAAEPVVVSRGPRGSLYMRRGRFILLMYGRDISVKVSPLK
jgi:hypothetical protein